MKKLIAIFAVLLFAAPALAADWSFFGSQRVHTWYIAQDYGDGNTHNFGGTASTAPAGEDDDWGLRWGMASNSRMGARVKADKVQGYIELALGAANDGDGDDRGVNTRRAFGLWKFSDNAALKVGKDYSPVSNLVSGQQFSFGPSGDDGLLGQGDFYGNRPAGLFLELGGFELALLTNALKDQGGLKIAGTDVDWNIPKIEARYKLKFNTFELTPFGGFQYFKVRDGISTLEDDIDVYSYVAGLVARVNIGAFYVAAEGAFGQNWANANWANGRNATVNSAATLDGTDDTNDAKSWMALGLVGLKFTDTLKFEAGFGFRQDDPEAPNTDKDQSWEAYLNAIITLAPGVYLCPEVGYIDFMDTAAKNNNDEGNAWYAGAKWQIDF